MRVLDFDGTVYKGASLLDFYLFTIRTDPRVLRFLPVALRYALLYRMGRVTLDQMDGAMRTIGHRYLLLLHSKPGFDLEDAVSRFWDGHMDRIMDWYSPREDDVVLTGSFDVVVGEACRRLGIGTCVGSRLTPDHLGVEYLNFGPAKPGHFSQVCGKAARVDAFFTDSESDRPMIDMAEHAYLVSRGRVTKIK